MEQVDAERLALRMMKKHGLVEKGWTFGFDRALRRVGNCNFTKKQITLSRHMVAVADEALVEQVMLHEIAHALLPASVKHSSRWLTKARSIGYTGKRTFDEPIPGYNAPKDAVATPVFASLPIPKTRIGAGTRLIIPNGTEVMIFKNARKRYHAVDKGGKVYSIAFDDAPLLLKR